MPICALLFTATPSIFNVSNFFKKMKHLFVALVLTFCLKFLNSTISKIVQIYLILIKTV